MAESLTTPAILPQTIAENGDATVIPATNDQTEGKASIAYGFPPLTSTPIADGGKMVRRADFNGLFNLLSQYALFAQNGGLFTFDANVSAAIGGYPLGARLVYTDSDGKSHIVKSLIPNNTYNFVSDPTYIDGLKWGYTFIDAAADNTFTGINTFTGQTYAPTPTTTSNTTEVATTAFVNDWAEGNLLDYNGYVWIAKNYVLQWVTKIISPGGTTVSFPTSIKTRNCMIVGIIGNPTASTISPGSISIYDSTTANFKANITGSIDKSCTFFIIAIKDRT